MKYCYWITWQKETRLPKETGRAQLVKVEGLSRWLRVWLHEFKQPHVAEIILKCRYAKFFGVDPMYVQVLRMGSQDRPSFPSVNRPQITHMFLLFLCFLLSSCSLFDAPDYTVDPRLINYVESFYSEAASRGVALPREVNVKVSDISDYGITRHKVTRSPVVWIGSDFLNLYGSQYAVEVEVIVFHELGHALLDRCHTANPESIMNASPCINCYRDKPELREKYLNELFTPTR